MSAAPAPETASTYPPAGLDRRFYAFALDRLIAWPMVALAGLAAWLLSWREGQPWPGLALLLGVALLVGLAFGVVLGVFGVSPGKAATGLRVVQDETGGPIGVGPALLRTLLLAVAGLPTFGLGVATLAQTAVMDPHRRRRGWHDRVTGSTVVDVRPPHRVVVAEDEAPRRVVNLTAMRLAPATAPVAAPVATPPRRTAVPEEPATPTRPAPAADPGDTVVRGSGEPVRRPVRWRVTFDSGESLAVDGPVLVGRRPEGRPGEAVRHLVPLRSEDMSVSKTHAQLQVAPDGALVVVDRGSTNGSSLVRSGVARDLDPGKPATLLAGDTVRFGDRSMTVVRES